jgi:predicted nucleotidyltransferase
VDFDLKQQTVLLVVAGSRAYGVHLPTSDVDVKGVCVPPRRYVLGCLSRFEQADKPSHMRVFHDTLTDEERGAVRASKLEGVVFDVRKFMALATEGNPNILDVLFCRDEEVRLATPAGRRLRAERELFVSAKARHRFTGYAASQLRRIKGHRAWLLDPPKAQPTRAELGLPERTLLPADQMAAASAAIKARVDSWELDLSGADPALAHSILDQVVRVLAEIQSALGAASPEDAKWLAAARGIGLDDNLILVMQMERQYEAALRHWRQYQEWKRNRNPARAALEERFGYDCKHAGHLVRLLRMGREILATGKVHVWRGAEGGGPGDADEIRAIRDGAWPYERLIEWAESEELEIERICQMGEVVVPPAPDREAIDRLCVELVEEAMG